MVSLNLTQSALEHFFFNIAFIYIFIRNETSLPVIVCDHVFVQATLARRLHSFTISFLLEQMQNQQRILHNIKLMKGKALRKHSLHEKTAASVLLKPFISSNE